VRGQAGPVADTSRLGIADDAIRGEPAMPDVHVCTIVSKLRPEGGSKAVYVLDAVPVNGIRMLTLARIEGGPEASQPSQRFMIMGNGRILHNELGEASGVVTSAASSSAPPSVPPSVHLAGLGNVPGGNVGQQWSFRRAGEDETEYSYVGFGLLQGTETEAEDAQRACLTVMRDPQGGGGYTVVLQPRQPQDPDSQLWHFHSMEIRSSL
jgi:hypothetical protein